MDDPRAIRLRQALELCELGERMVEQRLIREGVPPDRRAERLRRWRLDRPQAPHGDAAGRSIDVSRFQ